MSARLNVHIAHVVLLTAISQSDRGISYCLTIVKYNIVKADTIVDFMCIVLVI